HWGIFSGQSAAKLPCQGRLAPCLQKPPEKPLHTPSRLLSCRAQDELLDKADRQSAYCPQRKAAKRDRAWLRRDERWPHLSKNGQYRPTPMKVPGRKGQLLRGACPASRQGCHTGRNPRVPRKLPINECWSRCQDLNFPMTECSP